MDGIAVKAETTYGATEESAKTLIIGKEAVFVNTGNPIPEGMNAVIMIEDVHIIDSGQGGNQGGGSPLATREGHRGGCDRHGDGFPREPQNHPLRHRRTSGSGYQEVNVRKEPRVLILPTGSELREPDPAYAGRQDLVSGIIESNSYVLSGLIMEDGGIPVRHPIVKDDPAKIKRASLSNIEGVDLVLIIAGSSAGSEDYTRSIIEESGDVLVHGVSMMPGKPALIGKLKDRPIIGIPGLSCLRSHCLRETGEAHALSVAPRHDA